MTAIHTALGDMIEGLENSVGLQLNTDLTNEIKDIREEACGSTSYETDPCTEGELKEYISRLLL